METQTDKPVEYDSLGRMLYHPEYHSNHNKLWTEEDLEYLCKFGDCDDLSDISLALERTYGTVAQKKKLLKANGMFDYYRNLNKYWQRNRSPKQGVKEVIKIISAKSYFSGAGGLDLGMMEAGIDILESFEIDKVACETLRKNFNHQVNETDITKITVLDQQDADIYIGTFPCTKYSRIADIHGTRTGDDLFLHFFRHVALAQPEVYVVENVPGMKKFQVVMECLTRLPNYYVRVECPVNANMWLPQERKRLIVIGTKRPFDTLSYPESTPVRMRDIIEVGAEVYTPSYVQKRLTGSYRDKPIITDLDGRAPTCVAHYAKDRSTRLINDGKSIRPYSVREYARLQGFPDWFEFAGSENDAYRQIGNAVAVPMGRWIGQELKRYFAA